MDPSWIHRQHQIGLVPHEINFQRRRTAILSFPAKVSNRPDGLFIYPLNKVSFFEASSGVPSNKGSSTEMAQSSGWRAP